MGIFDLPAPLLAWLDQGFGLVAPPTLRLILWGLIGGVGSMALYWLLSPQAQIAGAKTAAARAKRALDAFDGEFADAWPLIRDLLGQALRQLRLVLWPALAASAPAICLLAWLSSTYGYSFPGTQDAVGIRTLPDQLQAALVPPMWSPLAAPAPAGTTHRIVVADQAGNVVSTIPWAAPIATIDKRHWWNLLIGNPAGYLPDDAGVERIDLDLQPNEYLPFGPEWLRAWYGVFFAALLLSSLAVKVWARID
jgi:hypothetical protein